jgi:4'-phosphopantetheinyl transferase
MLELNWSRPENDISLSKIEVHVWRMWLEEKSSLFTNHKDMLSPDELKVANKFFFDRDRNRYIIGRGTLRSILARYLSKHPQDISIVQGQHGKPALEDNLQQIEFNLSHSHDLALYAFTIGHRIGIDVEHILPINDFENTARSFLSSNELEALYQLPSELRLQAFYSAWTCKEAFSKALGVGIGFDLGKFEIKVSPDEEPTIMEIPDTIANGSDWHLLKLQPAPNYAAALAIDYGEIALRLFDF